MKKHRENMMTTSNRKGRFLLISCIAVLGALTPHAKAQDVDYSGLEELYGQPVTTSAIGKPQVISKTPVSMDIITSDEIRRSGAVDIPQILKRYAGVDVARNYRGQADVSIRGYNQPYANRLLVLINGRQVYQDSFGMTIWNTFPVQLSEIKQIEIVRGPNTSLFGLNASSGVINIVTFNPLYDNINEVEGRVGTAGYHEVSGTKTIKVHDAMAFRVSGGTTQMDGFSRSGMTPVSPADDAMERKAFNFDGQYKISDGTALRFEAGFNEQSADNTLIFHSSVHADTLRRNIKIDLSHDSGGLGLWNFKAYHNSDDYESENLKLSLAPIPTVENRLNVLQISNLFSPDPDHTFRLSGEYRDNSLEGQIVSGSAPTSKFSMDIYSGSGMWDWRMNDQWSWTNAARVDVWSTDRNMAPAVANPKINLAGLDLEPEDTEYSFNSGLVFQASPVSNYRLSVSRGVHIPSLAELAQETITAASEAYGNPALDAETNLSVDFGYSRKLPRQSVIFGSNLVYQHLEDVIVPTVSAIGVGNPLSDLTYENVGDSDSFLIELFARGTLFDEAFNWHANYTYTLVDDEPSNLPDHFLDFENTQPKHKINLSLGYTKNQWEVDADLHYVSDLDYTGVIGDPFVPRFAADVDSYVQLNARIGYNLTENTVISLDGFNLLDEHNERPSLVSPTGIGTPGANEIGRAGFLTLRHKF